MNKSLIAFVPLLICEGRSTQHPADIQRVIPLRQEIREGGKMIEIARWLIAFVAFAPAVGGLVADYFIPSSGAQHIKHPKWPPHAKVHNAQTIVTGFGLGVLALAILFQHSTASTNELSLSAILASLYWLCIFAAPIFLGTAFVDPEIPSGTPRTLKVPAY